MSGAAERKCVCCDGKEPAAGWHIVGYGGGDPATDLECFCSQDCFVAHEDGICGCDWEAALDEFEGGDEL